MLTGIYRYSIPLRRPVTLAHRGRQHQLLERQGLALSWHDGSWSECSPLPLFSQETLADCEAALLHYYTSGCRPDEALISANFAIDMAKDAVVRSQQAAPIAGFEGGQQRTIKLKCGGQPFHQDMANIARYVAAGKTLRIDCNQRWHIDQLSQCYAQFGQQIEFFEEPLADTRDYAHLSIPFALDEQLRQATLPKHAWQARAWVVKPMLSGLTNTYWLAEQAKLAGINLVLSSTHESNIAIEYYHQLAKQWQLTSTQGLGTLALHRQVIRQSWLHPGEPTRLIPLC